MGRKENKEERQRVKRVMKEKNERTAQRQADAIRRAPKDNHEDNEEWVQIHKSGR